MNKQQVKAREKRIESLMVTLFSIINSKNPNLIMIQELKETLASLGVNL